MARMAKLKIQKSVAEPLLLSEDSLLPEELPRLHELQPAYNLATVFEECNNHIYANAGLLKDRIYHEMVKLLVMKLHDEQNTDRGILQFGVTASEYRALLANHSSTFEPRMQALFERIRNRYPGLLTEQALKLSPLTLAFVVGRLQYISLNKTPGDMKGEAFQVFVTRHQRGDRGEFFTPHPIVRLAVEMVAPTPEEKVIDPACGSGGFLIQTLAYMQRTYPHFERAAYIRNNLAGIEFNPDVALSARTRFVFEGGAGTEITMANALLDNEAFDPTFDVVLTNPPFGSKGKVEDPKILKAYALAHRWQKTSSGGWERTQTLLPGQSPDILFIEKCLRMLRPGGRMAIVLPDGLLQNVSHSHIRYWIRSQAKALGVVSLPQETFIPYGTGIKTSLLLLQKLPANSPPACFMARMEKIGYDVKGQPVHKRDARGKLLKTGAGQPIVEDDVEEIVTAYNAFCLNRLQSHSDRVYTLPDACLNSRLDAEHYLPDDQKMLAFLHSIEARPLGALADILTQADDFRQESEAEIRYIAISDVDSRTMQVVSQQSLRAHEAPSRARYRVCKGDIITAVSGASTGTSRQATALITEEEDGAICSNGFAILRNIHGVEPLFLLAYLRTDFYLRQVRRLMTGHAIPAISTEDLSRVLVPVPPREDQEEIAQSIARIQAIRREALRAGEQAVMETGSLIDRLAK